MPTLLIDGAAPSCVGQGTCTNVGPAANAGTQWSIGTQVYIPNPAGPVASCGAPFNDCKTLTVSAGGAYLVSTGAGHVGAGMAQYHRQLLAVARAAGNADSSEVVLGENLAVIGYSWLARYSTEQRIADRLAGTTTLYQVATGITAQANIQQTGFQGPYVDLPVNDLAYGPWSSTGPTTIIGGIPYPVADVASSFTHSVASSGFKSAVLEQTQAAVAGMTAASTIKLIDANMNLADPSFTGTTYLADGTTTAGQNYYTGTIEPAIVSRYGVNDRNIITSKVLAGHQLLIPLNGLIAVGNWNGGGWVDLFSQTGGVTIAQEISGGMSGAFSGTNVTDPAVNTEVALAPPAQSNAVNVIINPIPAPSNQKVTEPVDSITGAYIATHDDLVTGGGNFPYALPFSRTYLSSSGTYLTTTNADSGIGNGWSHTYNITAQTQSDPYTGIGAGNSPAISAATSIAALYVMQDLLSVTPTAQTLTIASMVGRWFTDQLISNTVMMNLPDTTEEYVALPHVDGSATIAYNPPPLSSVQVTQTGAGQYTYVRKDKVALNFGPAPSGALQGWTYPNGVNVSLAYSGSKLTQVSNNLGRRLALSYSGNDITAVTDGTGRSVTYGYDGNHSLTSYTDPLGAVTTYLYDSTGQYDTFAHLTQVRYPTNPSVAFVTNWYDGLGRVIQQANANGSISSFFFAGSRTELIDPVGDRHVTYQTNRGRVLSDAWVLSRSFGNVFGDTPQQNGVINVATNQYNGLDQLILTTSPERDMIAYTYSPDVAQNLEQVKLTAKPGSSLMPLTTTYSYDPVFNKPTTITDPLGLVTTMSYDSVTGNLVSLIADANNLKATRHFGYNSVGQLVSATDPVGVMTQFTYDAFGNQTSVIRDPHGLNQRTTLAYDSLGDVISITDPNGNTATSGYDADRRVVTVTLPGTQAAPAGLTTHLTYDPDGRLLQTQQSANGAVLTQTFASYTLTGKTASTTDANGNPTRFAYDAADRLSSVTDAAGRVTGYGYDAMSRQTQVLNATIQASPLLQYSYTPDGLQASLTDGNSNVTSFTYDGFDRLATTTYPAPTGGSATTENYTYDNDGNVLTLVTRRGDTISFAYDTLSRLCTKAYAATAVSCGGVSGNYLVSYGYDLAGRLITASDNSSALPTVPGASASYTVNYSYDAMNRPTGATWPNAPSQTTPAASAVTFSHSYDQTNRRTQQTATDNTWLLYPTSTAATTTYAVNALNQYLVRQFHCAAL